MSTRADEGTMQGTSSKTRAAFYHAHERLQMQRRVPPLAALGSQ
jgi:hypothetical protein